MNSLGLSSLISLFKMNSTYVNKLVKLYLERLIYNKNKLKGIFNKLFNSNKKYSITELNKILNDKGVFEDIIIKRHSRNRIQDIQDILYPYDFDNMKVLDIGAGNANIALGIKEHYNLSSDDILVLDDKTIVSEEYTKIYYDEHYNILLHNNSVDVIILFNVIHHIHPNNREKLFDEMYRVLKPKGIVIVREHDDIKDKKFTLFLNLVHLFWYNIEHEDIEKMWLLDVKKLNDMFEYKGFEPIYFRSLGEGNRNLQRLYYVAYQK